MGMRLGTHRETDGKGFRGSSTSHHPSSLPFSSLLFPSLPSSSGRYPTSMQSVNDLVPLYYHAMEAKPLFDEFIKNAVAVSLSVGNSFPPEAHPARQTIFRNQPKHPLLTTHTAYIRLQV